MVDIFVKGKDNPIQLAERKDIVNPNLLRDSYDLSNGYYLNRRNPITISDKLTPNGAKTVALDKGIGLSKKYNNFFVAGQKYTYSVDVFLPKDFSSKINLYVDSTDYSNCKPKISANYDPSKLNCWQRVYATFFANRATWAVSFQFVDQEASPIYQGLPKLELGSVATPWYPAVEDYTVKPDFDSLNSRLTALESKMGGRKLTKPLISVLYVLSPEREVA